MKSKSSNPHGDLIAALKKSKTDGVIPNLLTALKIRRQGLSKMYWQVPGLPLGSVQVSPFFGFGFPLETSKKIFLSSYLIMILRIYLQTKSGLYLNVCLLNPQNILDIHVIIILRAFIK